MIPKDQHAGVAAAGQSAATVATADHVLTLVSSCVVNQRAFANTCGVPLGAHLDFQPSSALGLPSVTSRPPLRCNGCSGFLNVYCKTNLQKWVWKCNLCGTVNINKDQLGHSVDVATYPELCSEAVEYVQPLPPGWHPPGSLGPALPPPEQQPRPHLVLAVDTSMEPGDLQAAKDALLTLLTGPHVDPRTLVSLLTFDGVVALHNLGGTLRCAHVLPPASAASAASFSSSAGAAAAAAAAAGRGGGRAALAAAAASPAFDQETALRRLLDRHCAVSAAAAAAAAAAASANGLLGDGGDGGGAAGGAAGSSSGGGDGVLSGGGVAEALVCELALCAGQLPRVLGGLRTVQGDVPVRARARCLCSAVEAALRLIAAAACLDLTRHHNLYGSRVVVLAGGPPTRGAGAVPLELLDQAVPEKGRSPESRAMAASLDVGAALGALGAKMGVAVDIFTSTSSGTHARLLTAIAHGSGGELMPQLDHTALFHFGHDHDNRNNHLNHQTANQQPPQQPPSSSSSQQQQNQPQEEGSSAAASGLGAGNAFGAAAAAAATGGFIGSLLARQLVVALGRRFGLEGRLDCYCSEGLRLVQWMGPLDPIRLDQYTDATTTTSSGGSNTSQAAPTAAPSPSPAAAIPPPPPTAPPSDGASGPWRLSSSACGVVALEAGRSASLRLEVTRDLLDVPSLLLQVVLHFVDPSSRTRVVRVVSRKLQVVDSRDQFLRTVNPAAAAALAGKKAVLDAKKAAAFRDCRKAEEARYAVAAQLGLIATRCGREVQASRGLLGFGGRKLRQWPPELMPLAYALYHFQRGPLLGPPQPPPPAFHHHPHHHTHRHPAAAAAAHALWDSDARLAGMNALLWAAWSDAYRAMTPKLYAVLPPPPPPPPPPPSAAATDPATAAAAAAVAAAPSLAALPCVSLAAVMARTVPLLLDTGSAVLVSPTEEPGQGQGQGHDAAAGISQALLAAALAAAGCEPPLLLPPPARRRPTAAGAAAAMAPEEEEEERYQQEQPGLRRGRVPVPSVVLAPGAQAGGGALAARLIPSHHDGYEQQALQHPQLQQLGPAVAAQLSKQLREGEAAAGAAAAAAAAAAGLPTAQAKQAAAAAASFVQWCLGVNVQPFPL